MRMRNVAYVVPLLRPNSLRFVDALGGLEDVRLFAITNDSAESHDPGVRARFARIVRIEDCFSVDQVEAAAIAIEEKHGELHCLTSALEQIQQTLAGVRERLGIPGMLPAAVERFIDKNTMKQALRAAGLPCARSCVVQSAEEALEFSERIGSRIVVKPPIGAGCRSTYMADSAESIQAAFDEIRQVTQGSVQAEEFIEGDEYSFETITVGGRVRFTSISRYLPGPLDAVRNPWIQYVVLLPREIDGPEFDEIRRVGTKAVEALGMQNGFTHMEWFRKRDGSVAISEVAARPPGVHLVPMMGYAHETDFHRAWARAVVDEAFDGPWERKWSVGAAFLRGSGSGRVVSVEGVGAANQIVGPYVVQAKLPEIGMPKADGYEGEGYAIVRAPDTKTVQEALDTIINTVRVHYA